MLGEKLVADGHITQGQLDEALSLQKESGKKLGEVLTEKGYATQAQIDACL